MCKLGMLRVKISLGRVNSKFNTGSTLALAKTPRHTKSTKEHNRHNQNETYAIPFLLTWSHDLVTRPLIYSQHRCWIAPLSPGLVVYSNDRRTRCQMFPWIISEILYKGKSSSYVLYNLFVADLIYILLEENAKKHVNEGGHKFELLTASKKIHCPIKVNYVPLIVDHLVCPTAPRKLIDQPISKKYVSTFELRNTRQNFRHKIWHFYDEIQSKINSGNDLAKFSVQYFDLTNFMGEWRCWLFYYQLFGQRTWSQGHGSIACTQIAMYPCSTKTREVLKIHGQRPKRFPETRENLEGRGKSRRWRG